MRLVQRGLCIFQLGPHFGRVDGQQYLPGRDRVAGGGANGQDLALQVFTKLGAGLGGGVAAALDVGFQIAARCHGGLYGVLLGALAGAVDDIGSAGDQRRQDKYGQADAHRAGQAPVRAVHGVGVAVAHGRRVRDVRVG